MFGNFQLRLIARAAEAGHDMIMHVRIIFYLMAMIAISGVAIGQGTVSPKKSFVPPVKFWSGAVTNPVEVRRPGADAPEVSREAPARPATQSGWSRRSFDQTLRLQVELDRMGFSPGCIDGRWGSQTVEALRSWERQQELRDLGVWDVAVSNRFAGVTNHLMKYVVTTNDLQDLEPVPEGWPERAAMKTMGYANVRERLAEKFHAKESLLEQLNPSLPWPDLPEGIEVVVPNADTSRDRMPKASRLEVNLDRKFIEAFNGEGRLLAHFPCSIAHNVEKRPRGETTIVSAAPNPNYTFDPALFAEDPVASALPSKLIIPPGPNNPVGVAWIGLALQGYGMHGTPRPEDIGRTESHGCFRLHNWNAARLVRMVTIGMPVTMVRSD